MHIRVESVILFPSKHHSTLATSLRLALNIKLTHSFHQQDICISLADRFTEQHTAGAPSGKGWRAVIGAFSQLFHSKLQPTFSETKRRLVAPQTIRASLTALVILCRH